MSFTSSNNVSMNTMNTINTNDEPTMQFSNANQRDQRAENAFIESYKKDLPIVASLNTHDFDSDDESFLQLMRTRLHLPASPTTPVRPCSETLSPNLSSADSNENTPVQLTPLRFIDSPIFTVLPYSNESSFCFYDANSEDKISEKEPPKVPRDEYYPKVSVRPLYKISSTKRNNDSSNDDYPIHSNRPISKREMLNLSGADCKDDDSSSDDSPFTMHHNTQLNFGSDHQYNDSRNSDKEFGSGDVSEEDTDDDSDSDTIVFMPNDQIKNNTGNANEESERGDFLHEGETDYLDLKSGSNRVMTIASNYLREDYEIIKKDLYEALDHNEDLLKENARLKRRLRVKSYSVGDTSSDSEEDEKDLRQTEAARFKLMQKSVTYIRELKEEVEELKKKWEHSERCAQEIFSYAWERKVEVQTLTAQKGSLEQELEGSQRYVMETATHASLRDVELLTLRAQKESLVQELEASQKYTMETATYAHARDVELQELRSQKVELKKLLKDAQQSNNVMKAQATQLIINSSVVNASLLRHLCSKNVELHAPAGKMEEEKEVMIFNEKLESLNSSNEELNEEISELMRISLSSIVDLQTEIQYKGEEDMKFLVLQKEKEKAEGVKIVFVDSCSKAYKNIAFLKQESKKAERASKILVNSCKKAYDNSVALKEEIFALEDGEEDFGGLQSAEDKEIENEWNNIDKNDTQQTNASHIESEEEYDQGTCQDDPFRTLYRAEHEKFRKEIRWMKVEGFSISR